MSREKKHRYLHYFQRLVLAISYALSRAVFLFTPVRQGAVIGVTEIAGNTLAFADIIDDSFSVNLQRNPFFLSRYDFSLQSRRRLVKAVVAPALLGVLAVRYRRFLYIGAEGFLDTYHDGRAYEFHFLKRIGCQIACYYTGTDIRSYTLYREKMKELDRDGFIDYQSQVNPDVGSEFRENHRKLLAQASDRYADVVYTAPVDQISYMRRESRHFFYLYPDEKIRFLPEKWQDFRRLRIVHVPSSPAIKGTPLVRAAIKKLRDAGYEFEYVEAIGLPNADVIQLLEGAHIVLNQFYGLVPGRFGIEALAANTVMLCSSSPDVEPCIPESARDAWVYTPSWLIFETLRELLDAPSVLHGIADRGTQWARDNASYSAAREHVEKMFRA